MREIIFDTETTGLKPEEGHRLVEIGCVELENRVETGATFHAYINPGRPMPAEAEAVHGLSDQFLSDKPRFAAVVRDFIAFIGDAPLIAHNASFDMAFLNYELQLAGENHLQGARIIDTLTLARKRFPGAKHSLDALCARFGVDRSSRVKHGALLDAQLLAQVYVELAGGRQIGFELAANALDCEDEKQVAFKALRRPVRPHRVAEVELEAHRAFIAKIPNAIWNDP